jgi:hypothetical protein
LAACRLLIVSGEFKWMGEIDEKTIKKIIEIIIFWLVKRFLAISSGNGGA